VERVGAFRLAADHPCLAGHFPGHPLVPGVLALDAALLAIGESLGAEVAGLQAVKFLAAILPGDEIAICRAAPEAGRVRFECRRTDQVALRGTALLA
jgi:3-hydroxyacyl-[acyl-carrier-protein] dehydratase